METLWQDLRYGARMLARNPGFTAVAVLTLALGIGANTAIFSMVNAFFFRPLPVEEPDRLVVLATRDDHIEFPHGLSYRDYRDYRDMNEIFAGMALYTPAPVNMSEEGQPERNFVELVTGNYFEMLGVSAALGRTFTAEEDRGLGQHPVMVLGHGFWQSRFGGDPSIVGKIVHINDYPFTVLGVLPETFHGTEFLFDVPAYVPLMMMNEVQPGFNLDTEDREGHFFRAMGRLQPGVTVEGAAAAVNTMAARLGQEYPDTNEGVSLLVVPETRARPEASTADLMAPAMVAFMGMVSLVLLIACANLANLLLARATTRKKEMAVRQALGAGRFRIVRQLLTETLLLALLGGGVGLLIALWVTDMISAFANRFPIDAPIRFDFSLDARVFLFALVVAVVTGILAGILPAWRSASGDLHETLKEGGRSSGGAGRRRLRSAFVVAQVAVSLALLICAGFFLQSLNNARTMDFGFRADNLLLVAADPSLQRYDQPRARRFFRDLIEHVEALPGVESATASSFVPFSGGGMRIAPVLPEGTDRTDEELPNVFYNVVGDNYFRTLGIPILQGRPFLRQEFDSSRGVVVVNEALARQLWPSEDPIGRRLSLSGREGPYLEVVGVARDGKYMFLAEDSRPMLYQPMSQDSIGETVLQIRTRTEPLSLVPAVRQEVQALDAAMPIFNINSMETHMRNGNALMPFRLAAILTGGFGSLGLVLATVGLYGVIAYSVSQRTHEIGIRMALGAQSRDIFRLVIGQGMLLTGIGVGLGLLLAFPLGQMLSGMLLGVNPADPVLFAAVAAFLTGVALLACYIPARRATRVDPLVALRYE